MRAVEKVTELWPPVESERELKKLKELYKIGKDIPATPADLPEPTFSENAWYIAETRYARRDEKGEPVETPRDMLWRIAYNVATAERLYAENGAKAHLQSARAFYELMAHQEYIANTPTMLNAGKPLQQLSACFVLPVEDSLAEILETATDMAKIHKSGGGTGFSFSRLRPRGDVIQSSGGTTTGPIAFMQTYNDITASIRQGGVRRGANMGILHYTHPDVLMFAVYKVEQYSLTNFNISVSVDEEFFKAVERDAKVLAADYERGFDLDALIDELREALANRDPDARIRQLEAAVRKLEAWCRETDPGHGYALINPRTKKEVGRLNAKKVFDLITRLAWQYGDPGMIIFDRINNSRSNPTPRVGLIEATNPCGEQPLLPYDSCTLGSINLSKFINEAKDDFDWDGLRAAVHLSVNFLDDVLDMNEYPLEKVRAVTRAIRRIGLGIMGLADSMFILGIGYNTPDGAALSELVMKFIQDESDNASVGLAKIRGVFPAFEGSIYDRPGEIRPRNGARTTIAPTGTIALLADCSSGCEPLFALTYVRNTIEGKRLHNTNPYFLKALKDRDIYSEELLDKIQDNKGSVQGLAEIPEDMRRVFVVAGDISAEWHLRIQAALQKYTDNAISKTINFSHEATVKDVRDAYWQAYTLGCKGITIYRDGSRDKQVLALKKTEKPAEGGEGIAVEGMATQEALPLEVGIVPVELKPRPAVLNGRTYKVGTPMGTAFVSINENPTGDIFEVFIHLGRAGSDLMADAEAIGRLITLAFRIPSDYTSNRIAQNVVDQLSGIGGSGSTGFGAQRVRSLADAVARAISEHEAGKKTAIEGEIIESSTGAGGGGGVGAGTGTKSGSVDLCPECGSASLRHIEGCQKCEACGFSKC